MIPKAPVSTRKTPAARASRERLLKVPAGVRDWAWGWPGKVHAEAVHGVVKGVDLLLPDAEEVQQHRAVGRDLEADLHLDAPRRQGVKAADGGDAVHLDGGCVGQRALPGWGGSQRCQVLRLVDDEAVREDWAVGCRWLRARCQRGATRRARDRSVRLSVQGLVGADPARGVKEVVAGGGRAIALLGMRGHQRYLGTAVRDRGRDPSLRPLVGDEEPTRPGALEVLGGEVLALGHAGDGFRVHIRLLVDADAKRAQHPESLHERRRRGGGSADGVAVDAVLAPDPNSEHPLSSAVTASNPRRFMPPIVTRG